MEIIDLREAPQHIPTIARWHFDEWGYLNPGRTFEHRLDRMQRYLGDNPIPTMLIAVEREIVLGTAALGWKTLALESYRDTPVTLMRLDYQTGA